MIFQTLKSCMAGAALAFLAPLAQMANAGESGTSHVMPGATATLADLPGTGAASFIKPMYVHYNGSASANIPTAVGVTSNMDVSANTFALAIGWTADTTILGGAHYTFALGQPFTQLDIKADVEGPLGGSREKSNSVSGLGDTALIPVMLAWKTGNWQIDAMLPIFMPTGNYIKGRLGNTGLNYWTFDPVVGAVYSNQKKGFNAMLHVGYSINTENGDTHYKSGSLLHFDGAVEQMFPVGSGLMIVGAEGFYFDQVTCDSGSGATLGCFKGMTAGLGPVLGYIKPLGKHALVLEAKWLTELDTKNRLEGDYTWLKAVYKF